MLIEDSSPGDIVAYFERAGLKIKVHNDGPQCSPSGEPPEQLKWWVDLVDGDGRIGWPHFGSGEDSDSAIRRAAARWRVEQVGQDNQRKPGDRLP